MPSLLNDGMLAFDGWQLRGEMSSTLTRLRGMKCLNAADNRITLSPEDLGSMAGIESLLLSHNELLGWIIDKGECPCEKRSIYLPVSMNGPTRRKASPQQDEPNAKKGS